MPTEAFFHLEEQKKKVLLESAIDEFSALPYEKVSIFKIAQNAGVSRSGFYYYFKDKEDIYKYLIDQIKDEFTTELSKEKQRYDIFSLCKRIFSLLARVKGTSREAFIKQIVSNAKPDDVNEFLDNFELCAEKKHFEYLCDLDDLNSYSEQEMTSLTWLLICSSVYALQRYFAGGESLERAEERLDKMLNMLKYGVIKESKRDRKGGAIC
ncbi:TetR/AcrR family transcriptional regulator [Anaerovorax odorimutans]|uniref:TetR/AcrR family transcriptional regulator n=1 Tax=Anaerovorax odorimutans TaxID=109327 RepID=A0ABT1RL52_9FIRM|nr:TetR/AcrR family transcriptional regulator [Anaerovorax odorimutans]MCQ4635919.1 TetR/AcrR family transcriptional regulator [Anaerovorax odorimutans]